VKYQDCVAVVTGAGSGIGRALTRALTQDGAHVAASDIDEKGLAETKAACPPGQVSTYQADVADRDAVRACADDVRRDLGPASMVFNNAGVDLFASVADMSWADFDWLIGINVGGVVNGTKAFLPQLIESGSPSRPHGWSTCPVPSASSRCPTRAPTALRSSRCAASPRHSAKR
jgi:NAD(P)-dependent dehydrogenase (short-subunit alcohol dehydrogenase family)